MSYKSNPIANKISCVMYGINSKILLDNTKIKELLLEALKQENFKILGQIEHEFRPQGYTLVVLLAESHAAIHTYPEYNSLVFHIYGCKGEGDGRKTFEFLKEKLEPKKIDFHEKEFILKPNM